MECAALLLLLVVMCWLQQSESTCTLDFRLQGGENPKLDMGLDCPSCHFPNTQLETTGTCDLYSDLDFESGCSNANEECRKTYFLQNFSTSSSNATTDAADPDTVLEESQGECTVVMSVLGALVGTLVILQGIVLTGWVVTCWKLKKVAKKNSTQVKSNVESADAMSVVLELHSNAAYETQSYKQTQSTTT